MQSPSVLDRITGFVEWPSLRSHQAAVVIGALLVGCPLALGGAPAISVPIFALLSAVALLVSGFESRGSRSDFVIPGMAAIALVSAVQLAPLPPALLHLLDPGSEDASRWALQAFGTDLGRSWRALHRDPGTGLSDFVYFIGLCCMYFASQKLSARSDQPTVIVLAAASALVVALLAVIHLATGQVKVYGVYSLAHAAPPILSPLLNPNHLAALMGVGAILWSAMAIEAPKGLVRTMRSLAAVLCGVVCALSLSRGGVASAAGAMAVFVGLNARRDTEDPLRRKSARRAPTGVKRKAETVFGAALGVVVLAAGFYVASTSLGEEYLHGGTSKLENFRRALGLLRGHELLGIGSGGLSVAASGAARLDPHWTFLRAECLPLDLALSFGVLVAGLCIVQLVRALRAWCPPVTAPPLVVGAWCAFLSLIAHDMVDFSLYLGGVGYIAAALAGSLAAFRIRGWGPALKHDKRAMRVLALVPIGLVLGFGLDASHATLEADRDAFERGLHARTDYYQLPEARAALRRHPSDAYMQLLSGSTALARRDPSALRFVGRAMTLSPAWAEPHLLLARLLSARGLRSQAMLEAREALARSPTVARSAARVLASLHPPPDLEEIDRLAPAGAAGESFLEALAMETYTRDTNLSNQADLAHLRRAPEALGALERQASAALTVGDRAAADVFCQRMMSAHPREPAGWRCRAGVFERGGDPRGALGVLDLGLSRVRDGYPLRGDRARLMASLRDAAGMRRETDAMVELSGGDLHRRIEAHGARGFYEAALGNDRLAFGAYELANALALPDRPYLIPMTALAVRLRDGAFVERACMELLDVTPPDPAAVQMCEHRRGSGTMTVNPDGGVGQP